MFHRNSHCRDADGVHSARDPVNPFFAAKRDRPESDSFIKRRGCDAHSVIDAFHVLNCYAAGSDGHERRLAVSPCVRHRESVSLGNVQSLTSRCDAAGALRAVGVALVILTFCYPVWGKPYSQCSAIMEQGVRDRLREGKPVCFDQSDARKARTIPASWLENLVHGQDRIVSTRIEIRHAVVSGPIDFSKVVFRHSVIITDTVFTDQAYFASATFDDTTYFDNSTFDQSASFAAVHALSQLSFIGVTFIKDADFEDMIVGSEFLARGASFDQADFQKVDMRKGAFFGLDDKGHRTIFHGSAMFQHGSFAVQAQFGGTIFEKTADFDNAHFEGSAYFRPEQRFPVEFEDEAIFRAVKVGSNAEFQGANFKGRAVFDRLDVGGELFFTGLMPGLVITGPVQTVIPARFEDTARFLSMHVGGQAVFQGVRFGKEADFQEAQFDGSTLFSPIARGVTTVFVGPAYFTSAHFKVPVEFRDVDFRDLADFTGAISDGDVEFQGASFHHQLILRGARFRTVLFRDTMLSELPPESARQFLGSVDLRDFTYESINVDWPELLHQLSPYNRQPFVQFEKVLRQSGQDQTANEVDFEQWEIERRLDFKDKKSMWMLYWIYLLLAGYGVWPDALWHLLLWSAISLAIGTIFFSRPGRISYRGKDRTIRLITAEQTAIRWYEAVCMSVHHFLPIEVPLGSKWEPATKCGEILASMLRIVGWIIIPLFVLVLTVLLRRAGP